MSSSDKSSNPSEIDKQALYGRAIASQEWQDRLCKKATHTALDIPEDVDIQANKYGLGWKELLVLVIGMLGAGALFAANRPELTLPVFSPPPTAPLDSDYEVRFYNSDGELISVPRKPPPG